MKAVRYYGPGDIRVEDIPEPVVGDEQVKIKVSFRIRALESLGFSIAQGRMVSSLKQCQWSRDFNAIFRNGSWYPPGYLRN